MSEHVSQREIETLLALREQAREAHTVAAKKQAELNAEEERLMTALEAKIPVEAGVYHLLLVTEETGRSVSWRGIVERELGKPFAEKVLADAPPGSKTTLKVLQEVKSGAFTEEGR